MGISKPKFSNSEYSLADITDIKRMLYAMPGGVALIADIDADGMTAKEFKAAYSSKTALKNAFENPDPENNIFVKFGEIAKEPGNIEITEQQLEYYNGYKPGRRTTKVTVNILGLNEAQLAYFESKEFRYSPKALVLADENLNQYMAFLGLTWTVGVKGKADDLFTVSFSSGFRGSTSEKIAIVNELTG